MSTQNAGRKIMFLTIETHIDQKETVETEMAISAQC